MMSDSCPICKSVNLREWGCVNGFNLYKCCSCSHKFADTCNVREGIKSDEREFREIITNGMMVSDEAYYEHLQSGEGVGCPTTIAAEKVVDVARRLGGHGGRWLDVGCGAGILMTHARAVGYDVVGIEPGRWGQIAAAEKGLVVKHGYLEKDSFSQCFEIVSATDVVEHVEDPIDFLRTLVRYVSDDGHLLISIPFADSIEARLYGVRWDMVTPPTHCQFFTERSLDVAMEEVGLRVEVRCQYNIRRFYGLAKLKYIRQFIDYVIPGPQLLVVGRKL